MLILLLVLIAPKDMCGPDGQCVDTSIGSCIGTGMGTSIGLLYDFILTTPFFSYGLKKRVGIVVGVKSH
jgi:hypothetical protein